MIDDLYVLEQRTEELGDQQLHDLSYENAMAMGFLVSYTDHQGNDPFTEYDIKKAKLYFEEVKQYIIEQLQKVNSLFDEIKNQFLDDEDVQPNDDMIAEYCVENIMNYWDNGKKMNYLHYHLERDNFHRINSHEDYKRQIEEYNDLSPLDTAFKNFLEEVPYELVENIFNNRKYT